MSTSTRPSAPQLVFDDGSRAIRESTAADNDDFPLVCSRGDVSLEDFYELDSLVTRLSEDSSSSDSFTSIALQFPDDLLQDAPAVCQYLQNALPCSLVFVLGDTTFAPCCPDTVAAKHLHANVLVHFGHACLSRQVIPTTATTAAAATTTTASPLSNAAEETKIIYCFGNYVIDVHDCVEQVTSQIVDTNSPRRLLLLYDTSFQHVMEELQTTLGEQGDILVIAGDVKLPEHRHVAVNDGCSRSDCCAATSTISAPCAGESGLRETSQLSTNVDACTVGKVDDLDTVDGRASKTLLVGGLELPASIDMASFTVLYIGDPGSRQFLNIAMQLLSTDPQPLQIWTYHPSNKCLETSLDTSFTRRLNRRFYLVNKARQVSVFGLLVASLADPRMQVAVSQLQQLIDACGRSSYTVCVGKINPAKLANFAEIECYVLLACPEHALLDDESDFSTIVLTPFELLMSLDLIKWGDRPYSVLIEDCLQIVDKFLLAGHGEGSLPDDASDDEPYFNVATGRYESAPARNDDNLDLQALPGQGRLTAYNSVAAQFLKQRDYQGLEVKAGETEVRVAISGQQGIPSNYGDR